MSGQNRATPFGGIVEMTQFYRMFPNLDAARPNSSWTHYRLPLRLDDPLAHEWCAKKLTHENIGQMARN